jgi:hypothetical protein
VAQQGSPPRRPSRQPDPENRGRGDRRPRRAERPDRGGWQAHDAFGTDTDADLPPWAPPSGYQERPGGARPRPSGQRSGRVKDRYADPYADQYDDPYAATAGRGRHQGRADQGRADQASADQASADQASAAQGRAAQDSGHDDPAYPDGGHIDGGHRDGGYADRGYSDAAGEVEPYQGRRRGPNTLVGDDEEIRRGSYEPAEIDAQPDAPGPGRGLSRRRGRAAATRLRKSRQRVYRWAGMAIVIVLLAAGGVWLFGRSTPAPAPWVTKLLAGEYKSVPNACSAVSASALNAYLPASGRTQRVSVGTGTDSQCSYSFDRQPTFLVLEVSIQAFQPFAAAGNNGSATANAQLDFVTARQALARPPRKSPLPPATITPLAGLGERAFTAIQHEHVSGIGTDVLTIVIRQRNVLITVSCSGQESGHGFGPVPDAALTGCARAAAGSVLTKAESEPTA